MRVINEPKKLALCIISSLVLALFQPAFFADKSDAFLHTCADQYNNKMNGYGGIFYELDKRFRSEYVNCLSKSLKKPSTKSTAEVVRKKLDIDLANALTRGDISEATKLTVKIRSLGAPSNFLSRMSIKSCL